MTEPQHRTPPPPAAAAQPLPGDAASAGAAARQELRRCQGATARFGGYGMRLAGLVILVGVQFGLALPGLWESLPEYRDPVVQWVAFGTLSALLGPELWYELRRRRRPTGWITAVLVVTVAATAVSTTGLPSGEEFLGRGHWSYMVAGWFIVVLLLDRPLPQVAAGLGAVLVITTVQLFAAGLPDRVLLAGMGTSVVVICAFQLAVAAIARRLRAQAATVQRARREEERLHTRQLVDEQLHADHLRRYRELSATALPLLGGIADGSLDPADPLVRQRCAIETSRLRRLFAEHDETADPLVHELRACLDLAERGGLPVRFAVRGRPLPLTPQVRRALTEPVLVALAGARGDARVTLVRDPERVRVGVVTAAPEADDASAARGPAPRPADPVPGTSGTHRAAGGSGPSSAPGVLVREVTDEGRLWVEASYRMPTAERTPAAAEEAAGGPPVEEPAGPAPAG